MHQNVEATNQTMQDMINPTQETDRVVYTSQDAAPAGWGEVEAGHEVEVDLAAENRQLKSDVALLKAACEALAKENQTILQQVINPPRMLNRDLERSLSAFINEVVGSDVQKEIKSHFENLHDSIFGSIETKVRETIANITAEDDHPLTDLIDSRIDHAAELVKDDGDTNLAYAIMSVLENYDYSDALEFKNSVEYIITNMDDDDVDTRGNTALLRSQRFEECVKDIVSHMPVRIDGYLTCE